MLMAAQRIRVRGVVQGVGFRPFVWRLARELDLAGWVRNDAEGVEIEAHGDDAALALLRERLQCDAPPLARVDEVSARPADGASAPQGFAVIDSGSGGGRTAIGADTAVCADCLAEMFAPGRRRHYAFTTCTHCGPRYTIARSLPYDRPRTSLAPFPLCGDCATEYADPADRRFHAEATCCAVCGPQLRFLDAAGQAPEGAATEPLAAALALLREGGIVAVKALGGFHLVCDARNAEAVARLRQRKQREEKPFAVMAANLDSLRPWAQIGAADAALLESPERPIVLLRKHEPGHSAEAGAASAGDRLPGIAPGVAWLGAMLPGTPLQYLLFHVAAGAPEGVAWLAEPQDLLLVMTSANPHGEPLVTGDAEALERLAGIADAYLLHDRGIVARCDDSLLRTTPGGFQFVRRGRGFTPAAIRLPAAGPSVLAFGGWYKNTICVTRGDEAFVSTHVGDLDNAATCAFLDETVERMLSLCEVEPALVVHDLHPDFHSSRRAVEFAIRHGIPTLAVQHHHAHIAAVAADHGVAGPLVGLALDGVGLGDDGAAWGGELLQVCGQQSLRFGHLVPLPLPGGDRAAREPWRMAAAVLHQLGRGTEIAGRFAGQPGAATVATMLARGLNCPTTSSAGRLFDAAAGLLGLRAAIAYEGQAAMLLEGLAARHVEAHGAVAPLAGGWRIVSACLDLSPLLATMADAVDTADTGYAAALFHATLAAALVDWTESLAPAGRPVAAAGGCLLNHLLAADLRQRFAAVGRPFLEARRVPPNDGGLALGQAWVGLQTLRSRAPETY